MRRFWAHINNISAGILVLVLLFPFHSFAADILHSTLNNQTKQYDPDREGYILEQTFIWGKHCVLNKGPQKLAPGETTVLEIDKKCVWGGIKYNIVKDTVIIGSLSHIYRNKKFSLEVSIPCDGEACVATGVPPVVAKAVA